MGNDQSDDGTCLASTVLDNTQSLNDSYAKKLFEQYNRVVYEISSICTQTQVCDRIITYETRHLITHLRRIGNYRGSIFAFRLESSKRPYVLFEYFNSNFVSSLQVLQRMKLLSDQENQRRKKSMQSLISPFTALITTVLPMTSCNCENCLSCIWVTNVQFYGWK